MILKHELRSHYLNLRAALTPARRKEATEALCQILSETTGLTLSFCSFNSEINLDPLNEYLASTNRLILPKRIGKKLQFFQVKNLDKELQRTRFGLREPIPNLDAVSLLEIETALVPGLAFDQEGYRLGYGKGYYDRTLINSLKTIGVGYREQLHPRPLPRDSWDISLSKLVLT